MRSSNQYRRNRAREATRKGHHHRGRRRAASLLDLVVSILILGILASVAAPRLSSSIEYYRAQAAADRIRTDMSHARRLARARGVTETIDFDVEGNRYTFSSVKDPDSPSVSYVVDVSAAPYHARITAATFGAGTSLNFNGYGVAASGGSVTVQAGSEERTIVVDAGSGEVRVVP